MPAKRGNIIKKGMEQFISDSIGNELNRSLNSHEMKLNPGRFTDLHFVQFSI